MLYLKGPDELVNLSFENFQKNGVDDNGTISYIYFSLSDVFIFPIHFSFCVYPVSFYEKSSIKSKALFNVWAAGLSIEH